MIHVRLEQFEGPLGLLLYLIRKEEMDIYNIQVHRITSQYFEYIKKMRELDLEVAGDFIAMAATLIHIKSKMLLPQYDENGQPIEEHEDPRKELVQKLVEYQRFQEVSKQLNKRPLLGRDVWARGIKEEMPLDEGDIIVDEGGLFALISMYRKVVRQVGKNVHTVKAKGQSIAGRILELRDRLMPGRRVTLRELMGPAGWSVNKLLITFLSLLELTKMGFTTLFQAEAYADIHVDTKTTIDRDVIERVEEYDTQPEQALEAARTLEADAGGRDLHDYIQTPEDQLGLMGEEAMQLELATDDEILAAEAEMGLTDFGSGKAIDLGMVDAALANFSMVAREEPVPEAEPEAEPETQPELLAIEIPAEVPFENKSVENTVGAMGAEPSLSNENPLAGLTESDFELAWADFVEATPSASLESASEATSETVPDTVLETNEPFAATVTDLAEEARLALLDLNEEIKKSEELIQPDEAEDFVVFETIKLEDNDGKI